MAQPENCDTVIIDSEGHSQSPLESSDAQPLANVVPAHSAFRGKDMAFVLKACRALMSANTLAAETPHVGLACIAS